MSDFENKPSARNYDSNSNRTVEHQYKVSNKLSVSINSKPHSKKPQLAEKQSEENLKPLNEVSWLIDELKRIKLEMR